jgi:hypothetical protein
MYKALSLAALVGSAAATISNSMSVFSFQYPTGTSSPYYSASLVMSFDAGYGTQYNPQMMGAMQPGPDNSESYAFNIFSWVRASFTHEVMTSYTTTYDFTFNAIDFTPYGQTVTWSRFDNGQGFAVNTSAFHNLNVLFANTRVRENAKTCVWSAFTSSSLTPTCAYNSDKVTDYIDPVWQFNAG